MGLERQYDAFARQGGRFAPERVEQRAVAAVDAVERSDRDDRTLEARQGFETSESIHPIRRFQDCSPLRSP